MNTKTRRLLLAVGLSGVCWFWFRVGTYTYSKLELKAMMKDVSFPDFRLYVIAVVWSIVLLAIICGMFWSYRRALKSPSND
jgi:hypothetical protein